MSKVVDARGLACPQPVVVTRQALQGKPETLQVLVDNPTARDNVTRFARSQGCKVEVREKDFGFSLDITPGAGEAVTASTGGSGSHLFVLSADFMGKVDNDLGHILIKAFLNTLADRDDLPSHLILFNNGVNLACGDAGTAEPLKRLEGLGVTILICGTCLDFFGLKEELRAGTVSNMFEIVDALASTDKCITV